MGEEKPVVRPERATPSHGAEHGVCRDDIEDAQLRDSARMVEGEPVGDATAAVVAGQGEAFVPKR